jgi:hypothetical protein
MSEQEIQKLLKREQEAEDTERERLLNHKRIRIQQAPAIWAQVVELLRQKCADTQKWNPLTLMLDELSENEFRVRNLKKESSVTIRYDSRLPCITLEDRWRHDAITFRVTGNAGVLLEQQNSVFMPHDLVTEIFILLSK